MIASTVAFELIKKHEDFRSKAYPCPGGHASIGYGHKMHDGPVTDDDARIIWSEEHAANVLRRDIIIAEQALNKKLKVVMNQNQFDSLVSLTYNIGIGRLNTCRWLKELNKGNYSAVPDLMKLWKNATIKGKLITLPGLVKRRQEEADLFMKPYP
jgi:lysozyme